MITVTFNGQALALAPGCSLADALALQQAQAADAPASDAQAEVGSFAPPACATAVNGCFVPRRARASTVLQTGDAVTTFRAIVGG